MSLKFVPGSFSSIQVVRKKTAIGNILSDGRYYPISAPGVNSTLSSKELGEITKFMQKPTSA